MLAILKLNQPKWQVITLNKTRQIFQILSMVLVQLRVPKNVLIFNNRINRFCLVKHFGIKMWENRSTAPLISVSREFDAPGHLTPTRWTVPRIRSKERAKWISAPAVVQSRTSVYLLYIPSYWQGQEIFIFSETSRPSLGPTPPPNVSIQGFFPRDNAAGASSGVYLPRLRISGSVPVYHIYAFVTWRGKLYLSLLLTEI
jgi:hypothetical protein